MKKKIIIIIILIILIVKAEDVIVLGKKVYNNNFNQNNDKAVSKVVEKKDNQEITYKYRKNKTIEQKLVETYNPLLKEKIIYNYNSVGALQSDENGKATRIKETYYTEYNSNNSKVSPLKSYEIKKYNKLGSTDYIEIIKYGISEDDTTKKYVSNRFEKQKFTFNDAGELKTNNNGSAYVIITVYDKNGNISKKKNYQYDEKGKKVKLDS